MHEATPTPLRRRSGLSEQVYEHVKDKLLNGQFALGHWLPIDKLSEQFQVSRQPVMDAMRRLANEGLIEIAPQVGCRPRPYSAQEISDYYHFFSSAEALVVELAAQRAEPEDIAQMHLLSAQIQRLTDSDSTSENRAAQYRVLNRALHSAFRTASKSQTIIEIVDRLSDRSDYFVAISHKHIFQERLDRAQAEHEAIIAAIESGDGALASKLMSDHILAIEKRLKP